ncbi:MAG: c-type cytochrome [Burkholderiaceae bacterium]
MNRLFIRLPTLWMVSLSVGLATSPAIARAENVKPGAAIAAKGTPNGVAACASCHGAHGEGNAAASFPRLAGLPAAYLSAQLNHFADGTRQNPIMTAMAKQLSQVERDAVAAYFASLPAAAGVATDNADTAKASDVGVWLATRGRWDQELPACVQCHGPGGNGVGNAFPPLAGQSAAYLATQLHAFKDGSRPGGPMNLMTVVAKRMSDADITAVADYFGAANSAVAASKPETKKGGEKK